MNCCKDVMEKIEPSSCCTPQETAGHAARAMRSSGCGCAPVVEDTKTMKLVGVVTERDVCCHVAAEDRRASEVPVEEIMRSSSVCCSAQEPVDGVHRKLHEHQVTSLPVVDKTGNCCGTVSTHHLNKP
jgi:CBS domain-containing protein